MLVSCPNCQAKYNIDDKLISDKGKKLRCAKCNNVWTVTKEGTPESAEDILAKIGGRVNDIAEDKPVEKIEEEPAVETSTIAPVSEPEPEPKPVPTPPAPEPVFEPAVEEVKKESIETTVKEPEKAPQPEIPKVHFEPEPPKVAIETGAEKVPAFEPEPPKVAVETGAEKDTFEPETPKIAIDTGLENGNTDKNDMKEIFARISSKTEDVFKEEQKLPISKKISSAFIRTFGLQTKSSRISLTIFVVFIAFASFVYGKFTIVRYMPFMENVYHVLGIQTSIPGEGLEFQNVTRREFQEDYVDKMEIKGFIVNTTDERKKIPPIYAEMMDKETNQIESLYAEAMIEIVEAHDRVAFAFVINKPSSMMKYMLLTFKDEKDKEKSHKEKEAH